MGKVFWSRAVAALGSRTDDEVRQTLGDLARRELVRPSRSAAPGGADGYVFWHALVRDVAYAQIPRATRAERHSAAADWIESVRGERPDDVSGLLAHHRLLAFLTASEAHESESRLQALEAKAADALVAAGDASARLDQREASTHYRRALDLIHDPATRGPVLVKLVRVASEAVGGSGEVDSVEAERLAREAVDTLRDSDDPLHLGEAILLLAHQLYHSGGSVEASPVVDEAVAILEPLGPTHPLASALTSKAGWGLLSSRGAEGWTQLSQRALEVARTVDAPDVLSRLLQFQGWAAEFAGRPDEAVSRFEQSVVMARERGSLMDLQMAYTNLADASHECIGPARSLAIYREGVEYLRGRGAAAMWPQAESTRPSYALGDWDGVIRVTREVMEHDRRNGISQITGLALPQLARVLSIRGRVQEARELVDDYLPHARDSDEPQVIDLVIIAGMVAAVADGDGAAAISLAQSHAAFERGWDRRSSPCMWALPDAVRALIAAGDLERARQLLSGPSAEIPLLTLQERLSMALLAEAAGDQRSALEGYEEVVGSLAEWGCRYEEAMTHLAAGRCAAVLAEPDVARAHLETARATFSELDAVLPLVEVERAASLL